MSSIPNPEPQLGPNHPAVVHVSGAQRLLHALKERVGEHPELREAIQELEMALSILTVKTAGML
jgi:hypothetical protein